MSITAETLERVLFAIPAMIQDTADYVVDWGADMITNNYILEEHIFPLIQKLELSIPEKWKDLYQKFLKKKDNDDDHEDDSD